MRRAGDKTLGDYREVIGYILHNGPSNVLEIAEGIELTKTRVSKALVTLRTKEISEYIIISGSGHSAKYSLNNGHKSLDELMGLVHKTSRTGFKRIPAKPAIEPSPKPSTDNVKDLQAALARKAVFKDESDVPLDRSFLEQLADAGSAHVHGHVSLMGAITVAVDLVIDFKKPSGG